ncbi:SLATT domain-containing protein [Pseudomonas sp. 2FE]|uniref:SLATT domain-containing protein n=1 Tax=Pseudomonas sp. 2FE TaxID=2502190 RepID=UPI0010F48C1E|nr:SLATT domain-containing protein [Pseudomonas sp. 2FE]
MNNQEQDTAKTKALNINERTHLEDQIRECFGRVVYTHKTHEKMADKCSKTLARFKIAQIVVSALTASSAVIVVFFDPVWVKVATAFLSLLTLLVSGYMKGFDPGGTAQKHRDAAAGLWPIRESYLSLITDWRMEQITFEEATKRRDELQAKLAAIYKGAPQTDGKAYAAAQKALKNNEEYTFSHSEIDCFLPSSLRKEHGVK